MSKMLTKQDCKDLSHTICGSFYHGREKEFELWRNKKVPKNSNSIMYFYDNQTTAFLCFNIFKKNKNASLVWRETSWTIKGSKKINWDEEWIVIIYDPKEAKKFK